MSGEIVRLTGADDPRTVYVTKGILKSVDEASDGQKIVRLNNGVIFNFYPKKLKPSDKVAFVDSKEGYTGFTGFDVTDDSWFSVKGTSGDEKIVISDSSHAYVRANGGNDHVVVFNSPFTTVDSTGGGTGTVLGSASIVHNDKTTLKRIPGGYIFAPKSE